MQAASRLWLIAREWVDRTLRESAVRSEVVLLPGMLPLLPLALFSGQRSPWAWGPALAWFLIWMIFTFWCYFRYLKEVSLKSDREYDLVGKYDLPPEYADSESATKAKLRKKRERRTP